MKVRIDVLKAPWPEGARVGDVVEVQSITPAFAGKCSQVGDDVEATVAFALPDADPLADSKAEAKSAAPRKAKAGE